MVIVSVTPEIALDDLKTYAGGLGVLEGDKFYAAGDMGLDYLALSLFYRGGYVDYVFEGEEPIPRPEKQPRSAWSNIGMLEEFAVSLRGEEVIVRPLVYRYKTARAVLFEAVCPRWARRLTAQAYVDDSVEEQFLRYTLLAKASAYYLKEHVGLENIDVVDLQEAHTALLMLALPLGDRYRLVIHTPGPWGHPGYPGDLIAREFGVYLGDYVVLTEMALERVREAFVVSVKQEDVIGKVFPRHREKIRANTNGVYLDRWVHPRILSSWREKGAVDHESLEAARAEMRGRLVSMLRGYKDVLRIDNRIIVAWTRRLARYKRPYFIARFIEEHPDIEAFYVLAGKPHPRDSDGFSYARWFRRLHLRLSNVVYIHDYDVYKASTILGGSDLLLFTPFSGWEACGTSYMKAGANGTPVLSSRDGGVIELVEDGVNGWLFGEDIRDFINIYTDERAREIDEREYREFEEKLLSIIKTYYDEPEKYREVSRRAAETFIGKVDVRENLRRYYLSGPKASRG